MCMEEEEERKNNAKLSGHYVRQHTHSTLLGPKYVCYVEITLKIFS